MPIKLSLQRTITSYSELSKPQYDWVFRQESYTREPWETFDLPVVYGGAGVYAAYLEDEQDIKSWKDKLKEKALQELQEARQNIQQQIESLGNVS